MERKHGLRILLAGGLLAISSFLRAQDSLVIPLWSQGAPGFENRKDLPEEARDWWVKNINDPTLTVFLPPPSIATGAAALVCPGGGHRALVFNAEGVQVARFLNQLGIAAFVLKYRLFREEHSPYSPENAWQDVFRGMRMMKHLAGRFHLDTARMGVIGFSAGGELAGWLAYHFDQQHVASHDSIDAIWARPAFQVLVYPGPLAVPDEVPADAPQTFLVVANNDTCCSAPVVTLLGMHRRAHVPVELHLYANGDHAFNMGTRSPFRSLRDWPQRLADWLADCGISPAALPRK